MQEAAFEIKYLQEKLEDFYRDNKRYPRTEEGLKILTEKTKSKGQPYLQRLFKDPWGNEYHYIQPGVKNKTKFDLWTYGSDNKAGGNENHSKDIGNWD